MPRRNRNSGAIRPDADRLAEEIRQLLDELLNPWEETHERPEEQ